MDVVRTAFVGDHTINLMSFWEDEADGPMYEIQIAHKDNDDGFDELDGMYDDLDAAEERWKWWCNQYRRGYAFAKASDEAKLQRFEL